MRFILLAFLLLAAPAFAKDASVTYWPPEGCPKSTAGIATWQEGTKTGTRCITAQELLKLALPNCNAGQYVMFDGHAFVCENPPTPRAAER